MSKRKQKYRTEHLQRCIGDDTSSFQTLVLNHPAFLSEIYIQSEFLPFTTRTSLPVSLRIRNPSVVFQLEEHPQPVNRDVGALAAQRQQQISQT